jgi:hypothetical protein
MKKIIKLVTGLTLSLGLMVAANATPINLATSGTASQSSTGFWDWYATPELAIDGNTDGNYWAGSVAHTLNDYEAWWMVDLGDVFALTEIELWNRTDCCSERILPYRVSVLDSLSNEVWGQEFSTLPPTPQEIQLSNNVFGQFVKIQLVDTTDYLHLAEVKVFGEPVPVPEPTSLILLGLGIAGIGLSKRKTQVL